METRLVTPIDYVEPSADPWPPIFRILAIMTTVFGAFYALIGVGSIRTVWIIRGISGVNVPVTEFNYWSPFISPFIDVLFGLGVISGGAQLLRGQPYEFMIRGLRLIVLVMLFGAVMGIYRNREFLTLPFLMYDIGYSARAVTFPLLGVLILLAHRKAHPRSPLARKPVIQQPLPLLGQ